MVPIESGCIVRIPDGTNRRILHAAKLLSFSENVYTAKLEESGIALTPDQEIFVYYEKVRNFFQQAALVKQATEDCDGVANFQFETTSDPMSAESRLCYRVTTVLDDLFAEVAGQPNRQILDVSATGLSFISNDKFDTGKIVDIKLSYEDFESRGALCIQSVSNISPGRTRYGANIATNNKSSSTLEKYLKKIYLSIQRQQLQRLAGVV